MSVLTGKRFRLPTKLRRTYRTKYHSAPKYAAHPGDKTSHKHCTQIKLTHINYTYMVSKKPTQKLLLFCSDKLLMSDSERNRAGFLIPPIFSNEDGHLLEVRSLKINPELFF